MYELVSSYETDFDVMVDVIMTFGMAKATTIILVVILSAACSTTHDPCVENNFFIF